MGSTPLIKSECFHVYFQDAQGKSKIPMFHLVVILVLFILEGYRFDVRALLSTRIRESILTAILLTSRYEN